MTALQMPTDREQRVAHGLRREALRRIEELGADEAALRLALLPSGVRSLQARTQWSLETAFRVADALGLDTTVAIEESLRAKA